MTKKKVDPAVAEAMLAAEIERYRNGPVMAYINAGHTRFEAAEHFQLKQHLVNKIVRLVTQKKADPNEKPSRAAELARWAETKRRKAELAAYREGVIREMFAEGAQAKEVAVKLGVSKHRLQVLAHQFNIPLPAPPKREFKPPVERKAKTLSGSGQGFILKTRTQARTHEEDAFFDRRSKISGLLTADRNHRTPAPITLPRVSILEGVAD